MQQFTPRTHWRYLLASLTAALLCAAAAWPQTPRIIQAGLILDGVPASDADLAQRVQRWQQSRPTRLLDWLADGSLLVTSRVGDDEQLLRVVAPLQSPEQLSFFAGRVQMATAQAFTSDTLALIKSDAAGAPQLYLLDVPARRERLLLGAPDGANAPLWSHDGKRLAYGARLRNGQSSDLYVMDVLGGAAQLLASGGEWRALDWSLNDRYLLAMQRDANGDEQLQRIELATTNVQSLAPPPPATTAHRGRKRAPEAPRTVHIRDARFTPDGGSVIVLGADGAGSYRLLQQLISSGETQQLSLPMNHDVEHFSLSADARYVAYDYSDRGQSRLTLLDRRAGAEKIVAGLPRGAISALRFDRAGTRLAIGLEHAAAPSDAYVLDAATGSATRWTQSELGPINVGLLSVPVPFRFRTVDATGLGADEPNALIYRPLGAAAHRHPCPVLILLPAAGSRAIAGFDAELQMLVNELGLTVLTPSLHGSDGRVSREAAVRDVGALLAWIGLQADLDRNQVAIVGSGASSEVALAALTLYSERLQRGVIIDGTPDAGDMLQLQRPVLIARGFQPPPLALSQAEVLLWRARATRSESWLVSVAPDAPAATATTQRGELSRLIAQFLLPLTSGRTAATVLR
jgi:hypothetical protein